MTGVPDRALPRRGLHQLHLPGDHRRAGRASAILALRAATSYRYRVLATDAAGNLSGYSSIASATTHGSRRYHTTNRAHGAHGEGSERNPNRSDLERIHRQRGGEGVSSGAVPRCDLHELRRGSDRDRTELQQYRAGEQYHLSLPGPRGRRRRKSERLFERGQRRDTEPTQARAGRCLRLQRRQRQLRVADASGNSNTGTLKGARWTTQGQVSAGALSVQRAPAAWCRFPTSPRLQRDHGDDAGGLGHPTTVSRAAGATIIYKGRRQLLPACEQRRCGQCCPRAAGRSTGRWRS